MGKKIAAEEVQDSDLIEGVCDVLHHRRHRLSPREHHRDVKNHRIKPGVVLRTWLKTPVEALFRGMQGPACLACVAACHRRNTVKQRRTMAWWIWLPETTILPSNATKGKPTENLILELQPAPFLRLQPTSPARAAPVRPGSSEEETRPEEGGSREHGRDML
jgi:hypothetical protein